MSQPTSVSIPSLSGEISFDNGLFEYKRSRGNPYKVDETELEFSIPVSVLKSFEIEKSSLPPADYSVLSLTGEIDSVLICKSRIYFDSKYIDQVEELVSLVKKNLA